MKKEIIRSYLIIAVAIIYHWLFWQANMGLNSLIFCWLVIGILYALEPELYRSRPVVITTLGTLLTGLVVVWQNSLLSKVAHLLSFATMVGFAKQRQLRFLGFAFLLMIISFGEGPKRWINQWLTPSFMPRPRLAWRSFRLSLLPLLAFLFFYLLYYLANPQFSQLSDRFWQYLSNWMSFNASPGEILFFIGGLWLTVSLLTKSTFSNFHQFEANTGFQLQRQRRKTPLRGMLGLQQEFQTAWIMIIGLNVLLLLANVSDLYAICFEDQRLWQASHYSNAVHGGTYLLILSILLAMGILLYFFRRNLNFHPQNSKLKRMAYFWIAQNAILAFLLLLRNFDYILANGLAYKRIGVMIFLGLVFIGLTIVWLKISERKTTFFLAHINGWSWYSILIVCCFINWDIFITQFNLKQAQQHPIDYTFLLQDVSNKNIPLLIEHFERNEVSEYHRELLDRKVHRFQNRTKSWKGWNWSDAQVGQYLKSKYQE